MKPFAAILFILSSFNLQAQYDTSYIRQAFEYIKTDEFKALFKDYTETELTKLIATYPNIRKRAGQFREEQRARMNFWIMNECLASEKFYFVPDSNGKFNFRDSVTQKRFNKLDYSPAPVNCDNIMRVSFVFITLQTIQLDYFSGQDRRKRFGESNILRLKIVDGKFQFVARETNFWN